MKKLFLYILILLGLFMVCYTSARLYYRDLQEYVLEVQNNQVVVLEKRHKEVYESVDIDLEALQATDPDTYYKLKNGIRFEDKEKLYRYLESISS